MTTITFDTLKFVERLEKAGVPREQASAMAEAQKEIFAETMDSHLATKTDILKLENRFESLESRLESMELRLTIKLGAFLVAAVGSTVALIKLI